MWEINSCVSGNVSWPARSFLINSPRAQRSSMRWTLLQAALGIAYSGAVTHFGQELISRNPNGHPRDILKKAGFITSVRGRITVLDRPGLERASCDCYGAINRAYATAINEYCIKCADVLRPVL